MFVEIGEVVVVGGCGWWLEWGGSSVCVKERNRPCTNSACDVFLCSEKT